MKMNATITTGLVLLMAAGAFAQTPTTTSQVPGPSVHKAKIDPAPRQVAPMKPDAKQDRKAARKAELAGMTPDERTAVRADRNAKKAEKLAKMTPEQRKQYDDRKASAKTGPAAQKKALAKQERKAELAKMTPTERKAVKADHKANHDARVAAMTPEQRKQYDDRKARKKAERKKSK